MMFSMSGCTRQCGMVLLISLVFLLLLSLVGLSSMQGAIAQQKIASNLRHRNQSFQRAESGLRLGEVSVRRMPSFLPLCRSISTCAPPGEAFSVVSAGMNTVSGIDWIAFMGGLYGIQLLGPALGVAHLAPQTPAALYRVTAVGFGGPSRTVLESVYAQVGEEGSAQFRRVTWRQLQ